MTRDIAVYLYFRNGERELRTFAPEAIDAAKQFAHYNVCFNRRNNGVKFAMVHNGHDHYKVTRRDGAVKTA